ncbi:MAG TPA: GTPase HflX [Bryobacteraceae bacterium]|nr:GTPase HflX [Bryobacteraceae bacterium]
MGLELKRRAASSFDAEESLQELAELAVSAGAVVVDRVIQTRDKVEAATLIGAGKVRELTAAIAAGGIDAVIFDQDLTPTQQRNLEKLLEVKIIDRTQLILDIFASRARTREGRLQVELAQLNYLLPRLTGRGVQMSRLGGGIGTRGPGETQLETDRRRIARRIKKIDEDLEGVRTGRSVHRRQRSAVPLPVLALVGYTNAGKSTLFNRLTRAGVLADARMFATLDPTVRLLTLPSRRRVLVGDTVGFIRNLPTTLVKAFRATLEEVADATLILHVVDVVSPQAVAQTAHVFEVLAEIGASETPQVMLLNKIDRLPPEEARIETLRRRLLADAEHHGDAKAVGISALTGAGVDEMLRLIDDALPFDPVIRARFRLAAGDGASMHLLHEFGRVLDTRYENDHCIVEADVSESLRQRLSAHEV